MFDTTYISRNIPFCPAEAATIADEWHRRLGETVKGSRFIRCADRLWLSTEMSRVDASRLGVRHAAGLLWVGGFPVPVEFELTAWSTTATTVAIRPRSTTTVISSGRYAAAAYRALEDVAQSFLITREGRSARADSYRSVRDMLLERKFQWPARTVPAPVPFLRSSPAKESPRVTVASR